MAFDHLTQSDSSAALIDFSSSSPISTPSKSTIALLLASTSHSLARTTSLAMNPSSDDPVGTQPSPFNVEPTEATHNHDPELNSFAAQPISSNLNLDVDPQILEALKSKDRIYVLKLGEVFEALIKERRTRVEVTPATSYQRLLVHRCSAYYKLLPETDPSIKGLYVMLTMESRVPERRICELVPAELHTLPAFKIMKRSIPDGRSKPPSHSGSVAGEDADLSDVEPSESGSLGGQSNIAGSTRKKIMTMEQREAAYNEARSRIFMGFEEKEKGKETNPNSSALSISGSTSSTGRSNMGDTDDAASSPATESEWSATSNTFSRESKRDGRRGPSTSTSSRTLRAGGSLHGNGSGSSPRNSRAASPSFNYATIYEPPPSGQVYDASQHGPNVGYHPNPYMYPYSPNQGPNHPFMAPSYPYYPPHYPYQSPLMPQNPSDNLTPPGPEPFPHHQMNYVPPYGWTPHPNQPPMQLPPHNMHAPIPPQQPQHNVMHQMGAVPNMPLAPTFQPYLHPSHAYSYPMTSSYPTSLGQQAYQGPPAPGYTVLQPPPLPLYDPRATNGNHNMRPPEGFLSGQQYHLNVNNNSGFSGPRGGLGNGIIQPSNTGCSISSKAGNSTGNGGKKNIPAPPVPRATWSYGPGVSGFPHTGGSGIGSGESVGPRFNNSNRRTSGHISSEGNSRASSTNCDDVSSIASSSTTSSSSRRTYTSTTSSQQQHPLPPRPDWAVGLKAQPTLASRHHDHSLNNSRNLPPISPPRSNGQDSPGNNSNNATLSPRQFQSSSLSPSSSSQQQSPVTLHATDFPPLTNMTGSERRMPVATGAWGGSRPILSLNSNGNSSGSQSPKGEEVVNDRTSGRPGEFYAPRLIRRSVPATVSTHAHSQSRSRSPKRVKDVKLDSPLILAGQMCSMTLGGDESGLAAGDTPSP